MSDKLKISSIIIAKDEELNIKRCIDSQLDVVDEIVVIVDSSSSDDTYKIVSVYNNVVCEVADWKGFSEMKNYALSKTSNDWILWIDADEELTSELRNELINFKNTKPIYNAYQIARRAYFLGKWIKHSGWYPSPVTRLFNKKYCTFNNKAVHEGLTVNGKVGLLKNDLNHYTDPNIEHYIRKLNSYTSLAANELFNQKKRVLITDLIFRPVFIFLKMYIFKLGFLDGLNGFILALFSSHYVFTKYAKLWELNKSVNK